MTTIADIAGPAEATASRAYADALERLYTNIAASFAQPTRAGSHTGQAIDRRTAAATVARP
jgi:hypothetical protein